MMHLNSFPLTRPDDPPAKRVNAARREINYRLFFIRHALQVIEQRLHDRERGRDYMDIDGQAVTECLGLLAQHGGAIFRQLAEVRRLVVTHSQEGRNQSPVPPCGGRGVSPENHSQNPGGSSDE